MKNILKNFKQLNFSIVIIQKIIRCNYRTLLLKTFMMVILLIYYMDRIVLMN